MGGGDGGIDLGGGRSSAEEEVDALWAEKCLVLVSYDIYTSSQGRLAWWVTRGSPEFHRRRA